MKFISLPPSLKPYSIATKRIYLEGCDYNHIIFTSIH